jgi:tRNA (adenine57-N1/adenine58-N1)-methyltransferase
MSHPFAAGDLVLLLDAKRRRHLVTLEPGGEFHSHAGIVRHDDLLGQEEGAMVRTTLGARIVAVRPTLAEYVLEMPRGAQVIYPKDLGPILMLADVYPGARVLESGVGSGALTMTLLRAVGPEGRVTGYELREDFASRARRNVEGLLGPDLPLRIEVRDAYDGIDEGDLDRVVLDLPEPWRVVKHAETALRPGGILVAYLPTIGQVARLREELNGSTFGMAQTLEVMQRGWHVDGQSVRPDHRMVGHTGFLTHARRLGPAG